MSAKPTVLILMDTHAISGPARGLFYFLDNVDRSTIDFTIVAFRHRGLPSTPFIEECKRRGYPLIEIDQRGLFDPSLVRQLRSLMREERFNIIQTHSYKVHFLAALIKPFVRKPWIAFSHGWTNEILRVRLYNLIDRITLRFADLNVAVSQKLSHDLKRKAWLRKTPLFVPNALDRGALPELSGGAELRSQLGIPAEATVLGCFGRLSSEKNQLGLLKAFSKLAFANLFLIFVGEGPELHQLQTLAERLRQKNRIRIVGYKSFMTPYYDAISALVIPSLTEGLPNVLLEAMAYKKPVIATPVGEIPSIITHEVSGILTSGTEEEALLMGMTRYIELAHQSNSITERAFEVLTRDFDVQIRTKRVMDLYSQLLLRA